ncbi:hypothetical protein SFRURICE_002604 [Spodoptera frugiperda]|nr:hypothetical protein SFRURICE_002604 [Spodoptera frugiperda]
MISALRLVDTRLEFYFMELTLRRGKLLPNHNNFWITQELLRAGNKPATRCAAATAPTMQSETQFPIFPIPESPYTVKFLTPQKAGNALVTPLKLRVYPWTGDCSSSCIFRTRPLFNSGCLPTDDNNV